MMDFGKEREEGGIRFRVARLRPIGYNGKRARATPSSTSHFNAPLKSEHFSPFTLLFSQ